MSKVIGIDLGTTNSCMAEMQMIGGLGSFMPGGGWNSSQTTTAATTSSAVATAH